MIGLDQVVDILPLWSVVYKLLMKRDGVRLKKGIHPQTITEAVGWVDCQMTTMLLSA